MTEMPRVQCLGEIGRAETSAPIARCGLLHGERIFVARTPPPDNSPQGGEICRRRLPAVATLL